MSQPAQPAERRMKRIQLSVTYPDRLRLPLHRRITESAPVTRVELLMWSPTDDATTLVWCDGDRAATEAVTDGVESLRARELVAETDGTYAFLRQDDYEFPAAILDTVAGAGVIFLPPVVFLDTGAVEFEAAGPTEALGRFHDELSALGDTRIERVQPFRRKHSPSGLTTRQRAALEAATTVGYYEIPREGTIEDVATALDCSKSTAGELVRKAEAAVIRGHVETD